ncbi:MAG: DUF6691 family protein [Thiomonas sp.]
MKIFAFVCGLAFGFGLLISGMTDPVKVLGFLNIAGPWDPSLMLVMISAVVVALPMMQLASRREKALLGDTIVFPPRFGITGKLLLGSAIFGVGWGLDGLCPGPSLASLGAFTWQEGVFFLTMIAGMLGHESWQRASQSARAHAPAAGTS